MILTALTVALCKLIIMAKYQLLSSVGTITLQLRCFELIFKSKVSASNDVPRTISLGEVLRLRIWNFLLPDHFAAGNCSILLAPTFQ